MTSRISNLLKHELKDWGRSIGTMLLTAIGFTVMLGAINLFLGADNFYTGARDGTNLFVIFNVVSVGIVAFYIGVAGIVAGSEVPAGVRQGISRLESFVSKFSAAILVALVAGPLLIILNLILQVLPGVSTDSLNWNIASLMAQFLMYVAFFSVGFFISILWQRIGWLPTVIIIVVTVILTGFLGLTAFTSEVSTTLVEATRIEVVDVTLDNLGDFIQEVVDAAVEGNNNIITLGMNSVGIGRVITSLGITLVFGAGSFLMTKKLPVKVS